MLATRALIVCALAGCSLGAVLKRAAYAPAPPGGRPPCAEKTLTFCEDVEKYPTKLIQSLLRSKTFDLLQLFTDEREGLSDPPDYLLQQDTADDFPEQQQQGRRTRSIVEGRYGKNRPGVADDSADDFPEQQQQGRRTRSMVAVEDEKIRPGAKDDSADDFPEKQGQRFRSITAGENEKSRWDCAPVNRTATPRLAATREGRWRFVAQDEMTELRQTFSVQLCRNNELCSKACTQFYSQVPMLAVNGATGDVSEDVFWLPTSCRCFENADNES